MFSSLKQLTLHRCVHAPSSCVIILIKLVCPRSLCRSCTSLLLSLELFNIWLGWRTARYSTVSILACFFPVPLYQNVLSCIQNRHAALFLKHILLCTTDYCGHQQGPRGSHLPGGWLWSGGWSVQGEIAGRLCWRNIHPWGNITKHSCHDWN